MYVYICCSANSSFTLIIYFNNNNIAQECSTKNIYTGSLCNGLNSPRVHKQLK